MKFFNTLFTLLSVIVSKVAGYDGQVMNRFLHWSKAYSVDFSEHTFKNWLANDQIISTTNAKNLSYKLAHNSFSGYSQEEFRLRMNLWPIFYTETQQYQPISSFELPSSIDWRTKGVVNPIIENYVLYSKIYKNWRISVGIETESKK